MTTISVKLDHENEVLARLNSDPLLAPALKNLLHDAALLGQRVAREGTPKDTSALARSIAIEVHPLSAKVFTTLAHAVPIEEGRRAGAAMPPPAALEGWARRHGFKGELFVLARAISRRGVKGRFFMRAAGHAVQNALPRLLAEAAMQIENEWGR